jgi:L-alanine-DL-glutamate epimerase-like enolase superfamily enzyme
MSPQIASTANVREPAQRRHPAVVDWLVEWQDWSNPILQQPYEVHDAKLHIPDVPGVGLEWDEKGGNRSPGRQLREPNSWIVLRSFRGGHELRGRSAR